MKKLLLIIGVLLLTGCTAELPTVAEKPVADWSVAYACEEWILQINPNDLPYPSDPSCYVMNEAPDFDGYINWEAFKASCESKEGWYVWATLGSGLCAPELTQD